AVVWWHLSAPNVPKGFDPRSWQEILNEILEDVGYTGKRRHYAYQRVSAISGYILDKKPEGGIDEIYQMAIGRFMNRQDLEDVTKHALFPSYVYRRVESFRTKSE